LAPSPSTFVVIEREQRLADPDVAGMDIVHVGPDQVRSQPTLIPNSRSVVMVGADAAEDMLGLWPQLPADRRNRPFLFVVPADQLFLAAHLVNMGAVVVREGQDRLADGITAVLARAFGAGVRMPRAAAGGMGGRKGSDGFEDP
jgi:hypothetical protein